MLTLKLYRYSGDDKEVCKTLDENTATSLQGVFFDYYDEITPSIKVRTKSNLTDINSFNYCFIADLNNSYYFIDSIDVLSADVYKVNLRIDVLMTYRAEIMRATATVTTSENNNAYLSSREYVSDVRPIFEKLDFAGGGAFVEYGDIILTTIKGNV